MTQMHGDNQTRREFLVRTAKTGLYIAAAGVVSYALYDKSGPSASGTEQIIKEFPDFSIKTGLENTISIVRGSERSKTVRKAIELLGGIEKFIKKGDVVAIKPNVAFASPAMLGATTHPDLITEVVRLCYFAGAKKVYVTDNPINDPQSCFEISGIAKAAESAGAKLIMPREDYFKRMSLNGAKLIKNCPVLLGAFDKVDKLIGIAPVKDHHRSGASMTMKNFYGLLGTGRNSFHQDINTIITELALMVKPTLVILDGTEVMVSNGPTGGSLSDLKRADTIIAGTDMVAVDSFGATLLDLKVSDLPYLKMAESAGVGTTDYESLKPLRANVT
jgi:uncharacterized protein (DUF362 family)